MLSWGGRVRHSGHASPCCIDDSPPLDVIATVSSFHQLELLEAAEAAADFPAATWKGGRIAAPAKCGGCDRAADLCKAGWALEGEKGADLGEGSPGSRLVRQHRAQTDDIEDPEEVPSLWKVIATMDPAGVVVRRDGETGPGSVVGRLPLDSVVEERELRDGYLRFAALAGATSGPRSGWVKISNAERELLRRLGNTSAADGLQLPPPSPSRPQRSRALILLDWDDSLFPTTWFERRQRLQFAAAAARNSLPGQTGTAADPSSQAGGGRTFGNTGQALADHALAVRELLSKAVALGSVSVITLAERPWVLECAQDNMPAVVEVLAQLDVRYARELDPQGESENKRSRSPNYGQGYSLTYLKRRAMECFVEEQLERHGAGTTWDSLISIGDSEIEKLAAREFGEGLVAQGIVKYVKTVKLAEDPAPAQLTTQARELCRRLPEIIDHPGSKSYSAAYFVPQRF